jgi:glycosyltransferase involved in cell wall biosynthesis
MIGIGSDIAGVGARGRLLVWGHCRLDKRGSFEDYLLRLAERGTAAGWDIRVVTEGASEAMREALAARGATLRTVQAGRHASLAALAGESLLPGPHIVHFHFGSPSTMRAPMLRGLTLGGVRVVVTDHGSRQGAPAAAAGAMDRAKAWRRRAAARSVSLYLPVSAFVASRVSAEVGIPADRVRVLHNGVDLVRFSPPSPARKLAVRDGLGLSPTAFVVAFVGRMCLEKGVPEMIEAQAALSAARPGSVLLWVGDGPMAPQVAAAAKAHGGVFAGRRDDVDDMLAAADAVAVPSRWEEAFSLVLAEAAATGIPTVASRIGGIPEVVSDGRTGILVEPGDAGSLARALVDLADREPDRVAMGREARERAERLFGLDGMIDETLGHYGELAHGRTTRWKTS